MNRDRPHKPTQWFFSEGQEVDHFRIMRPIGRGGMGEVYLARDIYLGRKVALKVVQPSVMGSRDSIDRFLLEARATAKFNHPHIVTIYHVGEERGRLYIALEYIPGQTLRQRLQEEHPGFRESLRLALAISQALTEAHRHNTLHRDLKPENVIIGHDGRICVLDFGLAKILTREETRQITEGLQKTRKVISPPATPPEAEKELCLMGTPNYMAPEQWLDQETSMGTDIWALGVVMHELFFSRRPYEEVSRALLAASVCSSEPVPPIDRHRQVPPELTRLIGHCLEKDPLKRPAAQEVSTILGAILTKGHDRLVEDSCPFPGLLPFDEKNEGLFFGREAEISAFVERLRLDPVLPVVGPSGSGKSSFIQAGVIPRLREQMPWIILSFRPGRDPFGTLASRLLALAEVDEQTTNTNRPSFVMSTMRLAQKEAPLVDTDSFLAVKTAEIPLHQNTNFSTQERKQRELQQEKVQFLARQLCESPRLVAMMLRQLAEQEHRKVLIFVDQLEELYTLVEDENVRRGFMQAICAGADDAQDPVRVIFTLRDDFLGRLAEGRMVREALSHVTVVRSPDEEALTEILLRPLEVVGYSFDDPSMVAEMVMEVHGEPASLPMVQSAARMLWDRRDKRNRLLCRQTFAQLGGVAGALATHADGVLDGLSPEQLQLVRVMLLRLVTPEGTRQVLPISQVVEGLAKEAGEVLQLLISSRLVTVRRAQRDHLQEAELELAHEALIARWQRLKRWVEASQEELVLLAELRQAAELWERRGKRGDELWQGHALRDATHSMASLTTGVPELVIAFLEAAKKKEQRRSRNRRWTIGAGFIILSLISLVLAAQKREATIQKERAEAQQHEVERRHAEAQREGARAALLQGEFLEARAKLRGSLEAQDSALARLLWSRLSKEPLIWKQDLGMAVVNVAYSPDGKLLAAACADKLVYLLEPQTGQVLRVLRGHKDQVVSVMFSPDGHHLASGASDGEIWLWAPLAGTRRRILAGHTDTVLSLSFSPDSKMLASGSADKSIRLWEVHSGRQRKVLNGHTAQVRSVSFHPSGQQLASGGIDRSIRIWEIPSGRQLRVLVGHNAAVQSVSFSPDGKHLASGSGDQRIFLWDLNTGQPVGHLTGHTAEVRSITFSPNSQYLASGSIDRSVILWEVRSGKIISRFVRADATVQSISFSPDGKHLASGSTDKSVRVWLVKNTTRVEQSHGHTAEVLSVDFSPDGQFLASGSADRKVRIWDVVRGQEVAVLKGHTSQVRSVRFSPNGKLLASASTDQSIRLWKPFSNQLLRMFSGHLASVQSISFSPDGAFLASGSTDRTIRLWEVASGRQIGIFRGHTAHVRSVSFSPDGKLIASGSADHTVRLWQVKHKRLLTVLSGHTSEVFGVSFSPDGNQLASGSIDHTIRLWDLRRKTQRIIGKHPGRVYWLDFHPDGAHIGAPGSDGTVRIWDIPEGTYTTLRGHRSEVNMFTFSRDGRLGATASDDGTVQIWKLPEARPYWRAPALLSSPLQMLTHRGWVSLASSKEIAAPPIHHWQKEIETSATLAAKDSRSQHICLYTYEGRVEIWDIPADRRILSTPVKNLQKLLATDKGCLLLFDHQVQLLDKSNTSEMLQRGNISTISGDSPDVLVATDDMIKVIAPSNRMLATYKVDVSVTAIARSAKWLVVGYRDGNIELVSVKTGIKGRSTSFEDVPASPVEHLLLGSMNTIIAGYGNGMVGIWDLHSGKRLDHLRLHGAIAHLLLRDHLLHAVSELGDHAVLNLSALYISRCELLRRIWRAVPVMWTAGAPVLRAPPPDHPCMKSSAAIISQVEKKLLGFRGGLFIH